MITQILRRLANDRNSTQPTLPALMKYGTTQSAASLKRLMCDNFSSDNLVGPSPKEFESYIRSQIGKSDAPAEGYRDPSRQRDFSIQFEWGHNHDFGSFTLDGAMGDRHIELLAAFANEYGVPNSSLSLAGKKVLDIGCWTGGTSMLLAAMGADVVAIEEVTKYANCFDYMKQAFQIDTLHIENVSLYALDDEQFWDRFDIILYCGVLYHVSDPVLSLRILFNALKDGGLCLVETMATGSRGSVCEYHGAAHTLRQPRNGNCRWGWNWFIPSLDALQAMIRDVGFDVQKATLHEGGRALALATRVRHVDMLRAGLSKPGIR